MIKTGRLSANPHYYDYLHAIEFQDDNNVRFLDGAGQCLNLVAEAKYRIENTENRQADIEFRDFIELNPHTREKSRLNIPPRSFVVRKERGNFIFCCEVVWKVKKEREWPCLLYHERYVFDRDPLTFAGEHQDGNIYYALEQKDFTDSVRCYYADAAQIELSLKELQVRGFEKTLFWEKGIYEEVEERYSGITI